MNKKVLIIIIAIVLIGGGVAGFLLISGGDSGPAPEEFHAYSPGDYFVTNLLPNENGSQSLVRTTIMMTVDNADYLALLTTKELVNNFQPRVRDAILFVLRHSTYEQLFTDDVTKQSELRTRILDAVNENMRGVADFAADKEEGADVDHFNGVIISDFVIQ